MKQQSTTEQHATPVNIVPATYTHIHVSLDHEGVETVAKEVEAQGIKNFTVFRLTVDGLSVDLSYEDLQSIVHRRQGVK
ncbi:hypothetical protein [Paraburkholderia fynbosensis]|uniref:Uncharacterized protein n=1 Tax=Paraburkholderia fynbosensis TaxID=1200993 RepID=A0A6J5FJZ1_9BURK|nr:hypothetical protein [Paraburkholderia fynbosensis]CAB3782028.1 hypothetical protein LMG27177_01148 [Paraburkholderia fynbosensis]